MRSLTGTKSERRLEGIAACQGVAIGRAFLVDDPQGRIVRMYVPVERIDAEIERFRAAIATAKVQVRDAMERLRAELGAERAYILESHLLMLEDAGLWAQVEELIRGSRANAEWAIADVTRQLLDAYARITDDYLRERGSDITDVSHRITAILTGTKKRDLNDLAEGAIIIAEDLLPSVAADLDPRRVLGFVTNAGGTASHTSIIARSVNIPAVVGARGITSIIRSGETVIIDGTAGHVILNPAPETLRYYTEQQSLRRQQQVYDLEERELPAITRDGRQITLRANIELIEEIETYKKFNAAGVGLYRSEFLYSQADSGLPTEEEQFTAYDYLARMCGRDFAVVRTFDLGGDKLHLKGFKQERNPALGLRAIRLSLRVESIFRTQVRAILRAANQDNGRPRLKMLLPFVSNLDEVRQARRIIADVERELTEEGIAHAPSVEIGVMIEVPAAVIQSDVLSREADFFSLGTNDLTQSLLAVDRNNENVDAIFDSLHPAVLRALQFTARAARRAHIPINVCGEMASNPAQVIVLIGLGLTDLSMTPSAIPSIRRLVRLITFAEAKRIAEDALDLDTPAEVNSYVQAQLSRLGSQAFAPAHVV